MIRTQPAVVLLLLCNLWAAVSAAAKTNPPPPPAAAAAGVPFPAAQCAKKCHQRDCDNINIRYGKFCGVGHTGCPDQQPCDAADACCKAHDECVTQQGVLASSCHADFISCLDQVMLSGAKGFSHKCPYSQVIPLMQNGIQLTMMLGSTFGGLMKEL